MPYIGNIVQDFSVNNAMLNTDSVTSIKIDDGTIVNADINDSAAIAGTKLNPVSLADVGIGISTPNVKLHQHVGTSGTNSHQFTNTTTGTGSTDGFLLGLSGDEHVLLWNYENTPFRLATNGTERVRVSESGNVGIGTTSPSSELHVKGSGEILRLETTATTGSNYINFNDADENKAYIGLGSGADDSLAIWLVENSNLRFATNNSERMRIDSSGNVGIGTNSPTFSTFGSNTGGIEISDVGSSANALLIQSGSNEFFFANTSSANYIFGADNAPLIISTNGSERMRIKSTGTVGIGTTNPLSKLHIFDGSDNDAILFVQGADTTSEYVSLGVQTGKAIVRGGGSGSTNTALAFEYSDAGTETEGMRLDSSGRLLIRGQATFTSTSLDHRLQVKCQNTGDGVAIIGRNGDHSAALTFFENDVSTKMGALLASASAITVRSESLLAFQTNGSNERMRIDENGRLLLGTSTARAVGGESNPVLHIEGAGNTSNSWVNITRFQSTTAGPNLQFAKARSNTPGTYTLVQSGDTLGTISFLGADGTDMANYAATISAQVDGTAGSNDMPGRLVFSTTADGAGTVTERMRLDSSGNLGIGTTPRTSTALHISKSGGESKIELQRNETNTTGNIGVINFTASDGHSVANIGVYGDGDNEGGYINFKTTSDASDSSPFNSTTERMRIDSAGKVGINDTTPDADLSISNSNTSQNSAFVDIGKAGGNRFKLGYEGNNCFFGGSSSTAMFVFKNNVNSSDNPQASGNERMRIDGSGRLMLGTTTSTSNQSGRLNVFGTDGDSAFVSIRRGSDNASGPRFAMCKNRNTTDGSYSGGIVQNGDILGTIHFYANDGQGFEEGAAIQALIDGTPGSNDVPTMIQFQTTPDGSDTKQERMRINSSGAVLIKSATGNDLLTLTPTASASTSLIFNTWADNTNGRNWAIRNRYSDHGRLEFMRSTANDNSPLTAVMSMDKSGNIGAPSGTNIYNASDVRLKKNVTTLDKGLEAIKSLRPVSFNWIDGFCDDEKETLYGFIAQEVETVDSNLIQTFSGGSVVVGETTINDTLRVKEKQIIPILVKALQEAIVRIEALEAG